MKKLILLLLFIPIVSFGQKSNDADALKLCVALQSNNFTTDAEAEDAVNKILSVIGASQKPILQACSNINNAVAAVYKGQRYILYDRDFMNSLSAGSNKYWSNMFILAHEVGHHINGHSLDIILYANDVIDPKSLKERRKQELEADEFAGFVLAKLGATLSQTSKVLSNLPRISNENSSTHPSKDKRIVSVREGFKKGEIPNKGVVKSTKKNNTKPITKYSSKWKNIIEYPRKELNKEVVNPIDVVKNNENAFDLKNTSIIQGDIFEDVSRKWSVKQTITKPTLIITQFKNYKWEEAYIGDVDDSKPENNTRISIKDLPELDLYLKLILKTSHIFTGTLEGFVLDFIIDGEEFWAGGARTPSSDWKKRQIKVNENNEYFISIYGEHKKFIQKLKKGNKLYMRVNNMRMIGMGNSVNDLNGCVVKDETCYNTYVFDLKGSSKALQF